MNKIAGELTPCVIHVAVRSPVSFVSRGRSMTEQELRKHLLTTAPSCIRRLRAVPATLPEHFDENVTSVWQIQCVCGGTTGRFLGHSLKAHVAANDGAEIFISPLAFECGKCGNRAELLDTDRHGYHADVARRNGGIGSSKVRGSGPQHAFGCPGCGAELFEVTVAFVYWSPDELVEFDGNWEDLFIVFRCHCKCAGCGQTSQPTDFGKL